MADTFHYLNSPNPFRDVGGHYMPMLAKQIVDSNELLTPEDDAYLNFKGFAVGKPITSNPFNTMESSI